MEGGVRRGAAALSYLVQAAWSAGEAKERGIVVSDAEARERDGGRRTTGSAEPTGSSRRALDLIDARLREPVVQPASLAVTPEQIEAYVRANPRTDPEVRRVRIVKTKNRARATKALHALKRGSLWRTVARRYGSGTGAARTVERGTERKPLGTRIYAPRRTRSPATATRSSRSRHRARTSDSAQAAASARVGGARERGGAQRDHRTSATDPREMAAPHHLRRGVRDAPATAVTPQRSSRALTASTAPKTRTSAELRRPSLPRLKGPAYGRRCQTCRGARSPVGEVRGVDVRCGGHGWSSAPGFEGARVSDRFQRLRVPVLPTVLFADANEDYRAMARDALLEGRNATDMRSVANGTELLAYLQRAGATEGAVSPRPA